MPSRDDWQRRLGPLYGGAVALVQSTSWKWPTEVAAADRSAGWVVALGAPVGLVAWLVTALVRGAGLPPNIAALAGLAMLRVLQTAFTISFKDRFALGALVTFLVTVADVAILNIGAPFWGLVFGFAASWLLERDDFRPARGDASG